MNIEEIMEIEKRCLAVWGEHIPSWQNGISFNLSDKGIFLAHDVPAMIAAQKDSADKVRT